MAPVVATYSIAACDLEAGQWGVATESKYLAVGSIVPWARPGCGAVATQAYANPRYGPDGLALLAEGYSATEVVARLTGSDEGRDQRQLGVVDAAGGISGPCFAAQGNILVSGETVSAIASAFEGSTGQPLAERLIGCLAAAQAAGGDQRGQQSAALLVVERDGGYAGLSDSLVDLRVDDHATPVDELARIYGIHQALFGRTPLTAWLTVDGPLGAELEERLAALGFEGGLGEMLRAWAGRENLEERVDGIARIDPVVLEALRSER
jgi:uncharacterized Ntn-hydrolase superfamily protein